MTDKQAMLAETQLLVAKILGPTEEADIDFVLGQLGLSPGSTAERNIIRSFRRQMITTAASEALSRPAPVLGAGAREAVPGRTLDALANRIELIKPYAAKSPDGAEWDRYAINVSAIDWQRIINAIRALADTVTETGGGGEGKWQPIETAPHGTRVLLGWHDWRDHQWCVEVGPARTGQRFDNGYSNLSEHGSATHWQPLPPPLSVSSTDRGGK